MQSTNYYIFSFKARTDAIKFNSALTRAGVPSVVIATPFNLVSGCSLSVKVREANFPQAESVLRAFRYPTFLGAFAVNYGSLGTKTKRVI